ncbi:MAG: helix-turn-helix domain-containing protein [Polyangiaceae bacterium]
MHKPLYPEGPSTLGGRAARCRERLGRTQRELAEQAGISVTFLSEIENDRRSMGADVLLRLAEVLGVSVDYLLKGETEPQRHREPLIIPPELAEAAEERGWSLGKATDLLKANQLVVARRSRDSDSDRSNRLLSKDDWIDLHDRLFGTQG